VSPVLDILGGAAVKQPGEGESAIGAIKGTLMQKPTVAAAKVGDRPAAPNRNLAVLRSQGEKPLVQTHLSRMRVHLHVKLQTRY
jgi:hypothetical protein